MCNVRVHGCGGGHGLQGACKAPELSVQSLRSQGTLALLEASVQTSRARCALARQEVSVQGPGAVRAKLVGVA